MKPSKISVALLLATSLSVANAADPESLHNEGLMYYQAGNYDEALRSLQQAASMGYGPSYTSIGIMYKKGAGVDQDYTKAANWFIKAVEENDTNGIVQMAMMYETGRGVSKDLEKALELYKQARDQGYAR